MDADSNKPVCPRCGAEKQSSAPENVCPRCALAGALDSSPADHDTQFLALHDIPQAGQKASSIGDYELLDIIAHGGMGVVYRARQKSLNRTVALKLLLGGPHASDGFKRRFKQEAEMAAKLQHPNIVPIYEVGEHEGQPYFSMEYVAGTNLATLASNKPLAARKAAEFVKRVAQAVEHAHHQGVLHRDLKPSNILLGKDGRVRVTDFGLARQMDMDSSLTLSGQMLGTPGYLPPEQISVRHGTMGAHSDVYSMGAVLYYLLTARPPFIAESIADTLNQVAEAEPLSPSTLNPKLPKDLVTICLKCLQKQPSQRYSSAHEVAADLGRWLDGQPVVARRTGPVGRLAKWCQRKPMVATLVVMLLLVLGTGSILGAWQWNWIKTLKAKLEQIIVPQSLTASSPQEAAATEPGDSSHPDTLILQEKDPQAGQPVLPAETQAGSSQPGQPENNSMKGLNPNLQVDARAGQQIVDRLKDPGVHVPSPNGVFVSGQGATTIAILCRLSPALLTAIGPDKKIELDRIGESLDGQLIDRMNATRKLVVVGRHDLNEFFMGEIFDEAGKVVPEAVAKGGKQTGAKYLLIVTVDDFQDYVEHATFEGTGRQSTNRVFRFSIAGKIYDSSTGNLLNSANFQTGNDEFRQNYSVKGGELSDEMIMAVSRTVAERIANNVADLIIPAKVLTKRDLLVTINRGGTSVAVGQVFDVFAPGEKSSDPVSINPAGSQELKVGKVKIVEVDPKFSKAEILDDTGVVPGTILRRAN